MTPFPSLTPISRAGDPRCGACLTGTAPTCGAPALWHIAWTLTQPGQFSLLCGKHMDWAQQRFVYADRHPATVDCDMPGTGWLIATPSRCVMAPTTTT
ncbi:hypothetical protein [Streptomyces sp. NPDC048332]|uniref:hypothetical protein n=1 Tax=Streptomyces sp. NPDC048332 TaxID=3154619 RepID=UPI00341759B9